jgi:hypothetical protein
MNAEMLSRWRRWGCATPLAGRVYGARQLNCFVIDVTIGRLIWLGRGRPSELVELVHVEGVVCTQGSTYRGPTWVSQRSRCRLRQPLNARY